MKLTVADPVPELATAVGDRLSIEEGWRYLQHLMRCELRKRTPAAFPGQVVVSFETRYPRHGTHGKASVGCIFVTAGSETDLAAFSNNHR